MKKALLVGINDYPGKLNDLMGCVNDVHSMHDILVSLFGFSRESIVMITDSAATTFNILRALEMLVHEAKAGDLLVFHYSGHGSQVPDTSGDEPDKLDEIICPCDLDWHSNVIRDDELSKIFGQVPPGVHVEAILDCCHSGTAFRTAGNDYRKNRFLAMPEDIMPVTSGKKRVRPIKPEKIQVLWAACRSDQYAADAQLNGKYGGAFTTALCECLTASKGKIGRYELLKKIRTRLKKGRFIQAPQLETARKFRNTQFLG